MMRRLLRWFFRRPENAAELENERLLDAKRTSREIVTAIMDRQVRKARGNPELQAKMELARAMTLDRWAAEDMARNQ